MDDLPPERARPRPQAGHRARRLRLGRPARARPRRSWRRSRRRSACTRWPSRTRSPPTSGPSSSGTSDTLFLVAQDALVRRRGGRRRDRRDQHVRRRRLRHHGPPRPGLRAAHAPAATSRREPSVLTHGPSAVVYAVCDPVVDGYLTVVGRARGGRRRGRDVGLLRRSAPTTRRGSTCSSARSPRSGARCCRCASRCGASPTGAGARHPRATPRRSSATSLDHLTQVAETVDGLDSLLSTAFDAHLAQISVQQNDDMRKISAGVGAGRRADADRRRLRHELRPHARAALELGYPFALALMVGQRRPGSGSASSGPAGCDGPPLRSGGRHDPGGQQDDQERAERRPGRARTTRSGGGRRTAAARRSTA